MRKLHVMALRYAAALFCCGHAAEAEEPIIALRNVRSNLFADVVGGLTIEGQPLILFNFNGNKNQLFNQIQEKDFGREFPPAPIGFSLRPLNSPFLRMCLTVKDASKADFASIVQTSCGPSIDNPEGRAQLWTFQAIGAPPSQCGSLGCFPVGFQIVNGNSRKCIDARNASFPAPPAVNAPLQQFACAKDTSDPKWVNQAFDFNQPTQAPPLH